MGEGPRGLDPRVDLRYGAAVVELVGPPLRALGAPDDERAALRLLDGAASDRVDDDVVVGVENLGGGELGMDGD